MATYPDARAVAPGRTGRWGHGRAISLLVISIPPVDNATISRCRTSVAVRVDTVA